MPSLRYREFPWQKNLMKVPEKILQKIAEFEGAAFRAFCVKGVTRQELADGTYAHLGLAEVNGRIRVEGSVVPPADAGKYSQRNVEGWELVRKDLPMISKTRGVESPNFGDWSKGSHTNWFTREVYQREYYEARDIEISVEVLREPANDAGHFVLKFQVEHIIAEGQEDFSEDLIFVLNLLQENAGKVDVATTTMTREEYLATLSVDWEIFPPGTAEELIARFTNVGRNLTPEQCRIVEDRVRHFARLQPQAYIRGLGGQNSYIGAKFADDFVVFENVRYGNALYVLYEDWQEISQRPRTQLLQGTDEGFERIVHVNDWQHRLQVLLNTWRRQGRRA